MQNKETFGQCIRRLREEKGLPIRKVAAQLDIDPSTLSKIERGERLANKAFIPILSDLFGIEERQLLIDYLSDKVFYQLIGEEYSSEVLQVAEEKIKYIRAKNVIQSQMSFE